MNKKEIEKLIKKICPDKDIKLKYSSTINPLWAAMYDTNKDTIILNKKEFHYTCKRIDCLSVIFHELGHVHTIEKITSVVDDEYLAQKWAIKTAKKLKLKTLTKRLIVDFLSWKNFGWNNRNGLYRRYILASKKYTKELFK